MTRSFWQPSATLSCLRQRAQLLADIRQYFLQQRVLEVETPVLSHAATTDLHIDSFSSLFLPMGGGQSETCYLHTSPEYAMKRLLASGSGDIFQICKVFRNGEAGSRHNPEFTMLEWYRLGMDQHQLMDDMSALLGLTVGFRELRRVSYGRLFEEFFGLNPHRCDDDELLQLVRDKVDSQLTGLTRNDCLDLLFSKHIEPTLGRVLNEQLEGVYVYDYPASMAALARVESEAEVSVARRFELFIGGLELANGYHELSDAEEQRSRLSQDRLQRKSYNRRDFPEDEYLLEALESGLPDCAGVAIGLDRLLMLMANTAEISDVLAFDFNRA